MKSLSIFEGGQIASKVISCANAGCICGVLLEELQNPSKSLGPFFALAPTPLNTTVPSIGSETYSQSTVGDKPICTPPTDTRRGPRHGEVFGPANEEGLDEVLARRALTEAERLSRIADEKANEKIHQQEEERRRMEDELIEEKKMADIRRLEEEDSHRPAEDAESDRLGEEAKKRHHMEEEDRRRLEEEIRRIKKKERRRRHREKEGKRRLERERKIEALDIMQKERDISDLVEEENAAYALEQKILASEAAEIEKFLHALEHWETSESDAEFEQYLQLQQYALGQDSIFWSEDEFEYLEEYTLEQEMLARDAAECKQYNEALQRQHATPIDSVPTGKSLAYSWNIVKFSP